MKILSSVCVVHKIDTLFDAVEFQQRYRKNPLALGDTYLTPLYQHMQYLFVQHIKKITHEYDTEGFVPVASLNSVVGSPSSFIRYLIGSTGKI